MTKTGLSRVGEKEEEKSMKEDKLKRGMHSHARHAHSAKRFT